MIVPSIDICGGRSVQLVEGESLALEAGDPRPLLDRFSVVGEVAVVDIDAARGEGSNAELIAELCRRAPIRVGGGIRDVDRALDWLDRGAEKVIIGTAADPELLARLPRHRVIVALDAREGKVVTHGWRHQTDHDLLSRVADLRELCGGFLVTFVEKEGHLAGTDLARAEAVVAAAGEAKVTVAGGITTAEEVAALDRLGADAQVGMALYTGRIGLGDAVAALLRSDRPDGLWPTVVSDQRGVALGLVWSDRESLVAAVEEQRGVYRSRSRGLWRKGNTSGAVQDLLRVDVDCDRDTLRFTVHQHGTGFCHTGSPGCWGDDRGLGRLSRRLAGVGLDPSSNTRRLLDDPALLATKLVEEAGELGSAVSPDEVVAEAADLAYFMLVRLATAGVPLWRVEEELDRRERRVRRRPMEAKEW